MENLLYRWKPFFFRTKFGEKSQVKEIVLLGGAGCFFSFNFCDLAKVVIIHKKEDVAKFGYKLIGK
jgi:hypothetical protein